MPSPPPTTRLGGATAVVDAGVLRLGSDEPSPDWKGQRLVVGVQDDNCGLPGRIQAVKNGRAQGHSCVCLAPIGGMNFIFDFSRSSRSADCGGRLFLLTNTPFHPSGGVNMTEI